MVTRLAITNVPTTRHVEGVTKGETILTHVKYALKFEVPLIIFLQISGFIAEEVLRIAAGD